MNTIFEISITLIESFLIYLFLVRYSTMNHSYNRYYFLLFVLFDFLTTAMINLFHFYDGFFILINSLIALVFLVLFTKNSLLEKIFLSVFFTLLISIVNINLIVINDLLTDSDFMFSQTSENYELLIITSKIIYFILTLWIAKIRKKEPVHLDNEYIIAISIIAVVSWMIFHSLEIIIFNGEISREIIAFSLSGTTILILVGFYLILHINSKNRELTDMQKQNIIYETKLKNGEEVYKAENAIKSIRHDMKHLLGYIKYCLVNQKYEDAENAIFEEIENLNRTNEIYNSGYPILDTVLNVKLSQAKEVGFVVKVNFDFVDYPDIAENHFYMVLANILDNAIHHCDPLNKEIKIDVYQDHNQFKVMVSNPYLNTVKKEKNSNHGYGLNNVRRIVEDNGGGCYVKTENNSYTILINFPIKND